MKTRRTAAHLPVHGAGDDELQPVRKGRHILTRAYVLKQADAVECAAPVQTNAMTLFHTAEDCFKLKTISIYCSTYRQRQSQREVSADELIYRPLTEKLIYAPLTSFFLWTRCELHWV